MLRLATFLFFVVRHWKNYSWIRGYVNRIVTTVCAVFQHFLPEIHNLILISAGQADYITSPAEANLKEIEAPFDFGAGDELV